MTGAALPGWQPLIARHRGGLLRMGADADMLRAVARGRLVYLATPYSKLVRDDDGDWDWERSEDLAAEAAGVCGNLLRAGVTAVSPIALAHQMVFEAMREGEPIDPMDRDLWTAWCAPMLAACAAVHVPDVEGWAASRGILHEVTQSIAACRPVMIAAPALPRVAA